MVSLEKWKILTTLQKLPKNVVDLDKLIVAQSPKNRQIWSYWLRSTVFVSYSIDKTVGHTLVL